MTMETQSVQLVEFFLTVGVAWFTYSCIYKRVRNDIFREELFTVRDELFDYMLEHNLAFANPAYGLLRSSLNGMIRAAHEGSFNLGTFLIYLRAITSSEAKASANETALAIAAIEDAAHRKHLSEVFEKLSKLALFHLWLEGPLSVVVGPIALIRIAPWGERNKAVVDVGVEMYRHEVECATPMVA